jgi:hypothetical protein
VVAGSWIARAQGPAGRHERCCGRRSDDDGRGHHRNSMLVVLELVGLHSAECAPAIDASAMVEASGKPATAIR